MTDVFDYASELEQRHRDEAIALHRASQASGAVQQATECSDCDKPIPTARQKAAPGCTRCVLCEGMAEARRKLMNR